MDHIRVRAWYARYFPSYMLSQKPIFIEGDFCSEDQTDRSHKIGTTCCAGPTSVLMAINFSGYSLPPPPHYASKGVPYRPWNDPRTRTETRHTEDRAGANPLLVLVVACRTSSPYQGMGGGYIASKLALSHFGASFWTRIHKAMRGRTSISCLMYCNILISSWNGCRTCRNAHIDKFATYCRMCQMPLISSSLEPPKGF